MKRQVEPKENWQERIDRRYINNETQMIKGLGKSLKDMQIKIH
jgi:hypothetical protein